MSRKKTLTENERAEVRRYKEATAGMNGPIHWDVTDLPDEAVFALTAFAAWRVGEAFREVGRELVAEFERLRKSIWGDSDD